MFNSEPFYIVPRIFSYQHISLMLISAAYIVLMCFLLKKLSKTNQKRIMVVIMAICCIIFAGRMFFGYEGARIYNKGSKTTLLPLELCNANIIVTLVGIILDKKRLNGYLYFISALGATMSLVIFPPIHMNTSLFRQYMFFDYYIIHTQLVMMPIAMIVCGWYKPRYKDIPSSAVALFAFYTFLFIMCLILRNFPSFSGANYMYTLRPAGMPILTQLYNLIKVPYIYTVPCILLFLPVNFAMAFPFNYKGKSSPAKLVVDKES